MDTVRDYISSEPKEPGVEKLIQSLHVLEDKVKKGTPTSIMIRLLHAVSTHGTTLKNDPDIVKESIADIILKLGASPRTAIVITEGILNNRERLQALRNGKLIIEHTGITSKIQYGGYQTRGYLRKTGWSKTDGATTAIYSPISLPVADQENGTNHLFLVEEKVEELFREVCKGFDSAWRAASTLDEKLYALAYFHMWGYFVHPFCDANGRAFNAHLVLMLNTLGFPVDEIPHFQELHPNLPANILTFPMQQFRSVWMTAMGLPLIPQEMFGLFQKNLKLRKEYHAKFTACLESEIARGVEFSPAVRLFADGAVCVIKAYLSKKGFLDDNGAAYNEVRDQFYRHHPEPDSKSG